MSLTTSSDPAPISDKNWVKVGSSIFFLAAQGRELVKFQIIIIMYSK